MGLEKVVMETIDTVISGVCIRIQKRSDVLKSPNKLELELCQAQVWQGVEV